MLRHRLISGISMTLFFVAIALFDGWLDGSISPADTSDDSQVQATLLFGLICILLVLGQVELANLARNKNLRLFLPVTVAASVILGGGWYWPQVLPIEPVIYFWLVLVLIIAGLFLYQYLRYGTENVMVNCGINCLCIFYLAAAAAVALGIRIDVGLWPFLMFIFVIKSADIGAYTAGSLWGRHKFSPRISPGKTWEGMAGAIVIAVVISLLFGVLSGIMNWLWAILFGVVFAFIGQMSDLAESLIKRDVGQKDSADSVPGFGGVLDVIDSVLLSAPCAYLFFKVIGL